MRRTEPNYLNTGSSFVDEVESAIDPASAAMILDMLAKKYNHPYTAALREYVSNAVDSHKESGIDRPVEVTLPTQFVPNLVIRDHGIGLSSEDVKNVYSKFGTSTKNDSDEQIGGFGIGAKSAFAISDQFSIVSVRNGRKSSVIGRRDGGSIKFSFIVKDLPTDEENGVTVSVPIDRPEMYDADSVLNVLGGWKASEVTVTNNEKANERFADAWIETDSGYIDPKIFGPAERLRFRRDSQVVVGPVAYPFECDKIIGKLVRPGFNVRTLISCVIPKMSISEVTVAQSREVLEDTAQNLEEIRRKISEIFDTIPELLSRRIDEAPDAPTVIDLMWNSQAVLCTLDKDRRKPDSLTVDNEGGYVWNGISISEYTKITCRELTILDSTRSRSGKKITIGDKNEVTYQYSSGEKFILNDTGDEISESGLRKMIHTAFIAQLNGSYEIVKGLFPNNSNITHYFIVDSFPPNLRPENMFKLSEISDRISEWRKNNAEAMTRSRPKISRRPTAPFGQRIVPVFLPERRSSGTIRFCRDMMTLDEIVRKARIEGREVKFVSRDEKIFQTLSPERGSFFNGGLLHMYLSKFDKDSLPIFVGLQRNIKNVKKYTDYVHGSILTDHEVRRQVEEDVKNLNKSTDGVLRNVMKIKGAVDLIHFVETMNEIDPIPSRVNDILVRLSQYVGKFNHDQIRTFLGIDPKNLDPAPLALFNAFGAPRRYFRMTDEEMTAFTTYVENFFNTSLSGGSTTTA